MLLVLLLIAISACGGGTAPLGPAAQQAFPLVKRFASVAESSDEFANIFKQQPNGRQVGEISDLVRQTRSRGYQTLPLQAGRRAAEAFLSEYQSSPPGYITLVGHNSYGTFRFPDGSELDLSSLTRTDLITAVVSCESGRYVTSAAIGLPDELTYSVAFLTEQKYTQMLATSLEARVVSPTNAQSLLDAAYGEAISETGQAADRIMAYRLTGLGSTTVVGISVYQYQR